MVDPGRPARRPARAEGGQGAGAPTARSPSRAPTSTTARSCLSCRSPSSKADRGHIDSRHRIGSPLSPRRQSMARAKRASDRHARDHDASDQLPAGKPAALGCCRSISPSACSPARSSRCRSRSCASSRWAAGRISARWWSASPCSASACRASSCASARTGSTATGAAPLAPRPVLFGPLTVAANLARPAVPFNAIFIVSDPAQKWRLAANFVLYLLPFLVRRVVSRHRLSEEPHRRSAASISPISPAPASPASSCSARCTCLPPETAHRGAAGAVGDRRPVVVLAPSERRA